MQAETMNFLFDAIKYVRSLEQAGFERESAEFQAEALAYALNEAIGKILVTKEDLRVSETRLIEKIQGVESHLGEKIEIFPIEIRGVEGRFNEKIEACHTEIRGVENRLNEKIEGCHKEISAVEIRLTGQIQNAMFKIIAVLGGLMTVLGGLTTVLHFY